MTLDGASGTHRPKPAPPYRGEAPFALWHLSEDAAIEKFVPHVAATSTEPEPLVWAIDSRHAPAFWFPRDCPRGCVWTSATTSDEDRERFFGQSVAGRIHVIESDWLGRLRSCHLVAYRLPAESFRSIPQAPGYWVSDEVVIPEECIQVGDLLDRHVEAEIELRITPSIWPFWKRVAASTLEVTGSRLRNAADHPDRFS